MRRNEVNPLGINISFIVTLCGSRLLFSFIVSSFLYQCEEKFCYMTFEIVFDGRLECLVCSECLQHN
uniref:Ovule protein n=1 Tax=Ascaris lumbricoides TaxID=6252 RepID=A0A0M3IPF4_ASCLU